MAQTPPKSIQELLCRQIYRLVREIEQDRLEFELARQLAKLPAQHVARTASQRRDSDRDTTEDTSRPHS
jgi:hypothetical protein